MTEEEKLMAIFNKGTDNGWNEHSYRFQNELRLADRFDWVIASRTYYAVIFSHDFAQAFFGSELLCYDCGEKVGQPIMLGEKVQLGTGQCNCSRQFENNEPAWQFHLQQLVLEENPIDYLYKFVS